MNSDFTEKIAKYVDSPGYIWLPIVLFIFIIVLAGVIGWINGWKTALYFGGWNFVGLVSGVLITPSIVNAFNGIDILKAFVNAAQELFGVFLLFLYMLVVNFLAFLFYWIFRKKLKKSIKANKKAGKSNFSARAIGMGIAVATAAPSAVFISDVTAVMSPENGYTKTIDRLTRGFTGAKYDGTAEARVLIGNITHIVDFVDTIVGDGDIDLTDPIVIDSLEAVLNTDFVDNIDDIYDGLKATGAIDKDASLKNVDSKNVKKELGSLDIHIDPSRKDQLQKSLEHMFEGNSDKDEIINTILAGINK